MKKTTCKGLRRACNAEILGATPEEMGENSKKHVMKMIATGDKPHQKAIEEMMKLSKEDQTKWYEEFKNSFEALENTK